MGQGQERDAAIVHAAEDYEREGILVDFVRKHGTEVINILFTQFNMDDALKVRYEEELDEDREVLRYLVLYIIQSFICGFSW